MQWAEEYRLPDGNGIAGGTRRNLYLDIGHFLPSLGDRHSTTSLRPSSKLGMMRLTRKVGGRSGAHACG